MSNKYELMSLGFIFDEELENVLLIEKNKPDWQKGKLNGVGGHCEPNESYITSMIRECFEETGIETSKNKWEHLCMMDGYTDSGHDGEWSMVVFLY